MFALHLYRHVVYRMDFVSALISRIYMGKVHISPSNYHSIVNVPFKLPIVLIAPLKLSKNINVPPNTNKKIKITLIFFE